VSACGVDAFGAQSAGRFEGVRDEPRHRVSAASPLPRAGMGRAAGSVIGAEAVSASALAWGGGADCGVAASDRVGTSQLVGGAGVAGLDDLARAGAAWMLTRRARATAGAESV